MADLNTPPVRPDASPEDSQARPTNAFKAALDTFMYGSSDPSNVDKGEFRARGVFQHYSGEGQALAAGARPEVAASIYQAYANQGAQAAQAMRERYYAKEHRQMIQTQIIPLKKQFDAADADYRARTAIVNMPIPRTVTYEEGQQRSIAAQMATPAPPEEVQAGTTAEGKPKTKLVPGTPAPEPNPAAGAQSMSAVEFTPETMAFMDPVTGSSVPIASRRGRQIEQEATNDLMTAHNQLLTNMMDVFAQYPGNPFAVKSMQQIMDGVINQAGKAVTGRADPYEQLKWKQEFDEKQADIARKTTAANQSLLDLEKNEASLHAGATDALQMASQDPEFKALLGKKAQNYIKKGTPVEEWDPKTRNESAALASSQREYQLKDLQSRRQAGLVRIEPKEINLPDTWHSRLATRDEGYNKRLQQNYARMSNDILQRLTSVEQMPADEQDRAMDALGVPGDVTLRNFIKTGALTEDTVATWLKGKILGSEDYKNAQTRTYIDTISEITRQQPEVLDAINRDNNQFIQDWVQRKQEQGVPVSEIKDKVDYMTADTLGTHILSTTGENLPDSYRPAPFRMKIEDEYIGPRQVAPRVPEALNDARRDMGLPAQETPPEAAPTEEQPQKVTVTPEQAISGSPSSMSQEQLVAAMDLINPHLTKMEAVSRDPLITPEQRAKAKEAWTRLNARMNDLNQYHKNILERAGTGLKEAGQGFLIWREEQGEQLEQERLRNEKQTEALLRVVPRVN